MTHETDESVSRRKFLRNVALTAAAATAIGAGGASLVAKRDDTITFNSTAPVTESLSELPVPPAVQNVKSAVSAQADTTELLAQLAKSQAENMRLQAELDAAKRQVEAVQGSGDIERSMNEELSRQLTSANEQVGVMAGLVALYEQLDAVDVSETLESGVTAVAHTITDLLNHTPNLTNSVAAGQQALAEVEAHLPELENGRFWLDSQMDKVATFYTNVEFVLQNVLESVGTFLEMITNWFEGIQKWLPFGTAEKAAEVVNSLTTLIAETPTTLNGLQANIAQPLDMWLARDVDNQPRLQQQLIKPMREGVFAYADQTVTKAQQVQTTYQLQLEQMVATAVASRNVVRQQINEYRQQNQV